LATLSYSVFFCFTDPAPPALYTLSLHDALPICAALKLDAKQASCKAARGAITRYARWPTQAITYRLGREQIFALRERAQRELGAAFSLQRFHLAFMRQGTIPAGYFGEELLRALRATAP